MIRKNGKASTAGYRDIYDASISLKRLKSQTQPDKKILDELWENLYHQGDDGCELLREGANHSWWHNPAQNKRSAVPRHTEVRDNLVKKICKDLGIPSAK